MLKTKGKLQNGYFLQFHSSFINFFYYTYIITFYRIIVQETEFIIGKCIKSSLNNNFVTVISYFNDHLKQQCAGGLYELNFVSFHLKKLLYKLTTALTGLLR